MSQIDLTSATSRPPLPNGHRVYGPPSETDFQAILKELEGSIGWLRWAAGAVFAVGIAATVVAVVELPNLTSSAADRIAASDYSTTMMVFELLRGSAFAAAVTTILFGILALGRACLDQATRFQKRQVAAHFLNFVFRTYHDEIKTGLIKLDDVVGFLEAWSKTVDSAFTGVKFGSRRQDTSVTVGPIAAQTSSGGGVTTSAEATP